MNKLFLATTALLSGYMLQAQSQRLVFMEEFTQASCGPCAAANPTFNALLAANTSKAVSIKYQTSWPGVDPMNAQNPAEVAKRVAYYNVTGVPDAIMDGADYSSPQNVVQSTIDNEYAVTSPFTIQLNHWFNGANDSIYINCILTCTQNISMTDPRVRIAMVEKTINFTSAPGSNGETVFYNVMRKMYPTANGTGVATNWTVGQSKTISFNVAIPSYIYSKPQIGVVAWIQDDGDKSVQQAGLSAAPSAPLAMPPIADFSADVVTSCDGLINFSDQSALFPTSWMWDFGDGTTSIVRNPNHKYNANGLYTVKLTATNGNGNNLATKTTYINVNMAGSPPNTVNDVRCGAGVVNLSATPLSGGTLNWYNASGTLVNTGLSYSPNIAITTNYYVAEMMQNPLTNTGRADSALGGGGFFTANTVHGLYFDVAKPCTLVSVVTYANSTGNRTIQVLDAIGTVIQSAVVNIPTGMSTVTLNFPLPAGTGYFIKIATGSTVALYRNNANASYPYSSGVVTVTGNDANPLYYYFFYDWKVRQNPCASPSALVTGTDSCAGVGVNSISINNSLSVFPNPVTDVANVELALPESAVAAVSLYNVNGELVFKGEMKGNSLKAKLAIPVGALNTGMYLLKIETGSATLFSKLVK